MADDLFRRNVEFLRGRFAPLAEAIETCAVPGELVSLPDGDWDLKLGGISMYPGGARRNAATQIERFLGDPNRSVVSLQLPEPCPDPDTDAFVADLRRCATENGISCDDDRQDVRAAKLVVFGLGLGHHLPVLAAATECRVMIVVEPHVDLYAAAFRTMDFQGFVEGMESQGRAVYFLADGDPLTARTFVIDALRDALPPLIDGTAVFHHYNSPGLDAIAREVMGNLGLIATNFGFVSDEVTMVRNTYLNLRNGGTRYFKAGQAPAGVSAIVVGSGPSFDDSVAALKANQGRAMVISCGTALGLLLKHGIKPDIHCELENVSPPVELIESYRREHDLSGIVLLASTTVDPRLGALFERSVLFFRPGLSTEHLFGAGPEQMLANVTPMVSNLAMVAARVVGASAVYLMGIDLGSRNPLQHHSKESLYTSGQLEWDFPFHTQDAANFGGTALTHSEYVMSRHTKEIEIHARGAGIAYYNCSDGIRIQGAAPLRPEAMVLPELSPADKRRAAELLWEVATPTANLGQAWTPADGAQQVAEECRRLAAALPPSPDYAGAVAGMWMLARELQRNAGALRVIRGTAIMMTMDAFFRLQHTIPGQREPFAGQLTEILRRHLLGMADLVDKGFAELPAA
jgi:hypothetical protein